MHQIFFVACNGSNNGFNRSQFMVSSARVREGM